MLGLFLLLAFILTRWLWKPYLRVRDERVRRIEGAHAEAEHLEANSAGRLARIEAQLAEARKAGNAERASDASAGPWCASNRSWLKRRRPRTRCWPRRAPSWMQPWPPSEAGWRPVPPRWARNCGEGAGPEAGVVKRAWVFLSLAAVLVLSAGAVRAEDHPTLTEPVSGSFDHEPSQTGTAPATGEPAAGHSETAAGREEHGEHAGVDAKTLALQLLNFGVLLFILVWFGGRALSKAFRGRHDQLKFDIESAANQRALAEQRFHEQDARLANLEQELTPCAQP